MKPGFHFSVDDVFDSLLHLSDWDLAVSQQPFLAFCAALASEGGSTDLYLFRQARLADGRVRRLDELSERASDALRSVTGLRFGPHALDYATAPHSQPTDELRATMQGLFDVIQRFTDPQSRSRWLRLHYFSECFELAPFWLAHGVEGLLTTDKPAISYRLGAAEREVLERDGRLDLGGLRMIRSHLRLEFFAEEARDMQRFLARIDAAIETQGFVTLFTHEVDMADPRVRALAMAGITHLRRLGAVPL